MLKFLIHLEFETNFSMSKVYLQFLNLLGVVFGGVCYTNKICGFILCSKTKNKSVTKIVEHIISWCEHHKIERLYLSHIFDQNAIDIDSCHICNKYDYTIVHSF